MQAYGFDYMAVKVRVSHPATNVEDVEKCSGIKTKDVSKGS